MICCAVCGERIRFDSSPRAGRRFRADLEADRHEGWVHEAAGDHAATPWPPLAEPGASADLVVVSAAGHQYRIVGRLEEDGRLRTKPAAGGER